MPTFSDAQSATDLLLDLKLMNGCEQKRCLDLFDLQGSFADAMSVSDSLHIHIKVDDTKELGGETKVTDRLIAAGGRLDYSKEGFDKYCFPGGVNLIFSSIVVSQDELAETCETRRKRPFVDHFGIDMRSEADAVKAVFDAVPHLASKLGWEEVPQGDEGHGVHCCHVEVSAKHWVFPAADAPAPQIPLEFAFGRLKVTDESGGCDIRPMSPSRREAMGEAAPTCGH
jgi:hypothetical protein